MVGLDRDNVLHRRSRVVLSERTGTAALGASAPISACCGDQTRDIGVKALGRKSAIAACKLRAKDGDEAPRLAVELLSACLDLVNVEHSTPAVRDAQPFSFCPQV